MKSSIWLSCPPDFDILSLPFSSTHTFTLFLPHSQPQPPPSHSSLATFSAHCSTLCSMWRNKQVTMTLRNYDSKLLSQWLKLWAGTSPPIFAAEPFLFPAQEEDRGKWATFWIYRCCSIFLSFYTQNMSEIQFWMRRFICESSLCVNGSLRKVDEILASSDCACIKRGRKAPSIPDAATYALLAEWQIPSLPSIW